MSKTLSRSTFDVAAQSASSMVDQFIASLGKSCPEQLGRLNEMGDFVLCGESGAMYQQAGPIMRDAYRAARENLARIGMVIVGQVLVAKNADEIDQAEREETGSIGRSLDERG